MESNLVVCEADVEVAHQKAVLRGLRVVASSSQQLLSCELGTRARGLGDQAV